MVEVKTQHTRHKRRTGFLRLLGVQDKLVTALKGVLELIRASTANSERAAPASLGDARTPRVDVRLHVHLVEQGICPRSPLAALLDAVQALCDEEHLRRERKELTLAREGKWRRRGAPYPCGLCR